MLQALRPYVWTTYLELRVKFSLSEIEYQHYLLPFLKMDTETLHNGRSWNLSARSSLGCMVPRGFGEPAPVFACSSLCIFLGTRITLLLRYPN